MATTAAKASAISTAVGVPRLLAAIPNVAQTITRGFEGFTSWFAPTGPHRLGAGLTT